MGLFDFFKKKPSQESKMQSSSASPKKPQPAKKLASSPPRSLFEMRLAYGKVSLQAYKSCNWDEAMIEIQRLEDEGLGEASIALGQYAQMSDKPKALAHFRKAAAQGIAEGAWGCAAIIGHAYQADINGADKEWYKYCLQAARGGCADAMNELGNMYNRRNDYLGAFYWYQLAAYYDHPQAYNAVGGTLKKYMNAGKPAIASTIADVHPNEVKSAIGIFRCMTQQDELDEQRMNMFFALALEDVNEFMGLFLGHFFEDVVEDYSQAKIGYQIAANNNSIMGKRCLADMQAAGKGCERDMQTAFGWYKSAAESCEKASCFVMGEFTRKRNPDLAAYYYAVAYRRGFEQALTRLQQL